MAADVQTRFRQFYERHYSAVLGYGLRRTDTSAAEDIAAETFLVAWRRFDEVPGDALPWLLTVARNLLANHRRSVVRRDATISRLRTEPDAAVRDAADQIAARDDVLEAFQRLSETDREALALIAWDGLSGDRAARVLGCSVGAFWVRIHRARRRLARELETLPSSNIEEPVSAEPRMGVERG